METEYKRELLIPISMCDYSGRLSVPDTVGLFMDMATEVTEKLGVGLSAMKEQKFYWLTARTRCRFHRRPEALEAVTAATWAHSMQRAVCNRYYTLSAGDELLAEGKTEWIVFDELTGAVARTLDEKFSTLPALDKSVCDGARVRVSRDFSDAGLLGTYTVCSTDIDIGQHMNNVAYIRAAAGLFPVAERERMTVGEFEVSYMCPCYEGEQLRFYKREAEGGFELGVLRPDGATASAARVWAERIDN